MCAIAGCLTLIVFTSCCLTASSVQSVAADQTFTIAAGLRVASGAPGAIRRRRLQRQHLAVSATKPLAGELAPDAMGSTQPARTSSVAALSLLLLGALSL